MTAWHRMGLSAVALSALSLLMVVTVRATDHWMDTNLMSAIAGFSLEEVRGLQREPADRFAIESNRVSIDELRRRMDAVENQAVPVRLAVIEAKLDTLFELTRMLMGGAVLYGIKVVSDIIMWASKRRKETS